MSKKTIPNMFSKLQSLDCIDSSDILSTEDGFFLVYKSLSQILAEKDILDFPDLDGGRIICDNFFDDWFLYAVPNGGDYTYSLLKLREQEFDAKGDIPADGDTPGVTISFIAFICEILYKCLAEPTDENRVTLNDEINRVVAYRKQRHHKSLKRYFVNPKSQGAYLVAEAYVKHIASFSKDGSIMVSNCYKGIVKKSLSYKKSSKYARLPRFMDLLNQKAGYVVCDNKKIYITNKNEPTEYEAAAILATHTGNVSVYSFAAEVEYHAKFLFGMAKTKVPCWGRSIYDSAIRADMTICDKEFEGPAPFYQENSRIVKRQYSLHKK